MTMACLRDIAWPFYLWRNVTFLNPLCDKWCIALLLFSSLPVLPRNSYLGKPEWWIDTTLFVDMTGNISFHTTHETTERNWNYHIPLPEACHSRRWLQELNGFLSFVSLRPPIPLWSIKESDMSAPITWLFWGARLPSFWLAGSRIKSLPDPNTLSLIHWLTLWWAEQAWTWQNSERVIREGPPEEMTFQQCKKMGNLWQEMECLCEDPYP